MHMGRRPAFGVVAIGLLGGIGLGPSLVGCGVSHGASGSELDGGTSTGANTRREAGGPVTFTIDVSAGPARQFDPPSGPVTIPPYVYGINETSPVGMTGSFTQRKTKWGLIRKGGNSTSAWNWTNNYRNLGNLQCYAQAQAGGNGALAGDVTSSADGIPAAQAGGAAFIATVPIGDHVSAGVLNDPGLACPALASDCNGGMGPSKQVNTGNLDFVSVDPASPAFVPNAAKKPGTFCSCAPGDACNGGCTVSTNPVYQDEFAAFLQTKYGGGAAPVFLELDNEPNYWGYTHPELWPFTGSIPCQSFVVSYDDIVSRDRDFATALKAAWPSSVVMGPVVAQDGIVYAHNYDGDPHGAQEFIDYYLIQMATASAQAGMPLLDVLDLHYYTVGTADPAQCVQNPRLFWDPNYTDLSAASIDFIDFAWQGNNNYFDTAWYPRAVVPRLFRKIAAAFGRSGPGLAFSEYNSGCEMSIAGGVAEADDLGVFGREGVFAAAAMPEAPLEGNFLVAAYDLYRNYDGNGAVVGDTSVGALTNDVEDTSVYAFAHSDSASKMEIVAINKASTPAPATVQVLHTHSFGKATAYQLSGTNAAVVPVQGSASVMCSSGSCTFQSSLPPMSATTFVLR
jgi:hypothetical protein